MFHLQVGRERGQVAFKLLSFIIAFIIFIVVIYPLIQMILISLKSPANFFQDPLGFPKHIRIKNYLEAWGEANVGRLFFNTVFITFFTIVLTMFVASLAGFAISKYQFKGKKLFYNYFMIGLIVPIQVLMVSLMRVSRLLHLQNTLALLIFLFSVFSLSLAIFLYTGFFKTIPSELLDAARIDGCTFMHMLFIIILPLSGTINAIVAILVGMNPWKDFLIPLLFSTSEKTRTLSLGILQFQESFYTNWTLVFAIMVMQTIPMLVLFIMFQRFFIKGVIGGSIKQ